MLDGSLLEVLLKLLLEVGSVLLDSLGGLLPSLGPERGVSVLGVAKHVDDEASDLDVIDGDLVAADELLVVGKDGLELLEELQGVNLGEVVHELVSVLLGEHGSGEVLGEVVLPEQGLGTHSLVVHHGISGLELSILVSEVLEDGLGLHESSSIIQLKARHLTELEGGLEILPGLSSNSAVLVLKSELVKGHSDALSLGEEVEVVKFHG